MKKEILEDLWSIFLEKERLNIRNKKRRYLHFDYPVRFTNVIVKSKSEFEIVFSKRFKNSYISNDIFKTGFYPFIHYVKEIPRYKYDKSTEKRKKVIKPRPLKYASHNDALKLSWLNIQLNYSYEKLLEEEPCNTSVLAYRKFKEKRSNIDFAFNSFDEITKYKTPVAICFDVEKFFDRISHDELKSKWLEVFNKTSIDKQTELPFHHYHVFKTLSRFQFVTKDSLEDLFSYKKLENPYMKRYCTTEEFRLFVKGAKLLKSNPEILNKRGIPQGSPVSALLANISMLNFDRIVHKKVSSLGGKYYRYSDDILVFGESNIEKQLIDLVNLELAKIGLNVNEEKIDLIRFKRENSGLKAYSDKGELKKIQYLGFEFDGQNAFVRSSSLSRYHGKMRRAVNRAVRQAYGKKSKGRKVFKSKLISRYISISQQDNNFISYVYRASAHKYGVNTENIIPQVSNRRKILKKLIESQEQKYVEKEPKIK